LLQCGSKKINEKCLKRGEVLSMSVDAHFDLKMGVHLASEVFFPTDPQLDVCDGTTSASIAPVVVNLGLSGIMLWVSGINVCNGRSQRTCLFSQGNPRDCVELG
jgi:hypothetical protein